MAIAFGRKVKVIVYAARKAAFFGTEGNGIEITALRVQGKIERHSGSEPNTAEVSITNLDPDTARFFVERPLVCRILAGYQSDLQLLFAGDVRHTIPPIQDGPDWVHTLQLADGSRAFRQAKIRKSYKRGTPAVTVVRDVAASMGLIVDPLVSADLSEQLLAGYTLDLAASEELTSLLSAYGYEWSIQNGALQLSRVDKPAPGVARVVDTWIGQPQLVAPDSKKSGYKAPVLKGKTLLNPGIVPGRLIHVTASGIDGNFKVRSAIDDFDTHGQDWTTTIEAKPL